jgi:hypothetical protein
MTDVMDPSASAMVIEAKVLVNSWSDRHASARELEQPTDLALELNGEIFVADGDKRRG